MLFLSYVVLCCCCLILSYVIVCCCFWYPFYQQVRIQHVNYLCYSGSIYGTGDELPQAVIIFKATMAFRWCCGTGCSFLFIHTLSPSTALELQYWVVFGLLNALGFSHVQNNTTPIGTRLYHPNHTLLHIASARTGMMMNRVQTLQGFAWRPHVLSSILNKTVIIRSKFIS